MTQDRNILVQFYLRDKKIYWNGTVHTVDDELFSEFNASLDQKISTDKDRIVIFNWYNDGSYSCEKEKNVYDFRLQEYKWRIYDAHLTLEEATLLKDNFLNLFEETRIKFLQENKDAVKQEILQQFDLSVINLRGLRDRMLSKSDWTQIPDVPLDSDLKSMWATYRQKLRDITDDPNWNPRNILDIDFPIDPENYLLRYPNKEVEFLSTQDQWENYAAVQIKQRLIRFMLYLAMPSVIPDLYDEADTYETLKVKLEKFMRKIDPELELNINLTTAFIGACSDAGTNLQSGLTPEAKEILAKLIEENPDIYYADHPDIAN